MGYSPWGLKELDTTEQLSPAQQIFYGAERRQPVSGELKVAYKGELHIYS